MTTLTVGSNKQYQTVSSAIAASQDGDTINVDAGTYTNDFAHITTNITLNAVGGMVNLVANIPPSDGKAILTTDGNITINGFSFSGAAVADANGAGIRMQTGNLTINDCYFHHNENGILTSSEGGTLTIDDSEFAFNGRNSVFGTAHNIYVGHIDSLIITDSYFHDANIGHEIKSRAGTTIITNNRIQDQAGTSSYSIDISNGGNATITNNVIEQGPNSENNYIIAYGTEGMSYASNSLVIDNNTIINDKITIQRLLLENTDVIPQFTNNDVFGLTLSQLPTGHSGTTFLPVAPTLDTSPPFLVGTQPPPPPPEEPPPPPPPADLVLIGSFGHQDLVGGNGNDIFNGKAGKDTITTGLGRDTIIFDQPPISSNRDTVTDFNSLDIAQLSSAIFTNPALINYRSDSGNLCYANTILAVLPIGLELTAVNFKIG